jgi:hypothetical protein
VLKVAGSDGFHASSINRRGFAMHSLTLGQRWQDPYEGIEV